MSFVSFSEEDQPFCPFKEVRYENNVYLCPFYFIRTLFFKERERMWILIISLIALAIVAAIAGIVRNRRLQKKIDNGELDAMPEVQEVDMECCGQHEVCEKESLLAAVSKK